MKDQEVENNLKVLKQAGIRKPRANNLARLPWVTESYIKAHVRQAVEIEGQSLGLAIWRMENKKEAPSE